MHQRKSKKVLVYFFLFVIISSINNVSLSSINFNKVQKINVSGLSNNENKLLLNQIKKLNLENIFLINVSKINSLISSNTLVESYEVFKKYPSTINFKIKKTIFLARINKNGKTFLIGSNGKYSLSENKNNHLPYVFGKPDIKEFLKFKKIIDQSKLQYDQIDNLFFFPSKRWDIKLKNNVLLKLSNKNVEETLNNVTEFLQNYNVDKFTIFDVRISNQIILNE
tara:strand:+ start:422 stop:1093 length:672 start_codon:yes stop_codon:yes gene_type:complete